MVISERTSVPPRYRLIEEVGQGGMAIVYRAQDDSLRREVAVKVLHPHLSAEPECKARLEREAQAVAKLKHDNILEIFDYSGGDAESAYIVTEFIDGQTLKQFLGGYGIKHPELAALIAAELAGALVHAHGMGIIHRDVKPENVMIRKDGLLKLMDFGIAQVLDLERMTVTGQLLGSPAYMAPELVEGRPLTVRTDVFSVGILLYQMATGALPFSGKNPHEVLRRITDGLFPDPRGVNRLVGVGLSRIISRALARDPDARYPDMRALLADLRGQLVDAGFGELRDELRAFFADPSGYEKALPGRMTPALAATAERQLAAGNAARALECWNRVLAYAPDDAAVSAALKRWEGRSRRRVVGFVLIGGAAVLALAIGIGEIVSLRVAKTARAAAAVAPRAAVSSTALGSTKTAVSSTESLLAVSSPTSSMSSSSSGLPTAPEPRGAGSRPFHPRALSETSRAETASARGTAKGVTEAAAPSDDTPPPAPPPVLRTFALGPTPQNVDVYLDGERQFAYDTDHRSLSVPWNVTHVVEFRSPSGCCFVERVELGPDRPVPPENIISRKLKWKPARLVVTTTPAAPDVRIMVRDPARPGRGTVVEPGEEANVPFLPSDEAEKEIEISVDSAAVVNAERVTVRAGERKSLVIPLGQGAGPGPAARPASGSGPGSPQ